MNHKEFDIENKTEREKKCLEILKDLGSPHRIVRLRGQRDLARFVKPVFDKIFKHK